jgi:hypothetical protein
VGTPGNPLKDKFGRDIVPADYSPAAAPNAVSFGFTGIAPPSLVYIQRDDLLVLQGNTTLAGGDTLTIGVRLLLAPQPGQEAGRIVVIQSTLALTTQGVSASRVINLAEGYLLSIAITSANAASFGQTYASAFVGQGSVAGAPPSPSLMLVADYPTTTIPVGWPGVPIRQSAQGQGFVSSANVGNPAAGSDLTFTATTGLRTRVHSIRFLFAPSAAAAVRVVRLRFADNAGNVVASANTPATQAASNTMFHTYALGGQVSATPSSDELNGTLPQVDMASGWTLKTNTLSIQAADAFTAIWLAIETWVA